MRRRTMRLARPRVLLAAVLCVSATRSMAVSFYPETATPLGKEAVERLSGGGPNVRIDDMIFDSRVLILAGFKGPKWPGGKLYYAFDAGVKAPDRNTFVAACKKWSAYAAVSC